MIKSNGYKGNSTDIFAKLTEIYLLKNKGPEIYGGNIHIEVDRKGSEQLIRFIDNGVGIPDDVLNKIGEPFNTTKDYGNGLGIMVSKKIIDSHQGKINFSSLIDSGTRVDICLPILK